MKTSSYAESPQTDSVIQQYEKVMEGRIAEKILKASQKSSVLPTFTEEETAFLKVRAGSLSSELVVETPAPNITIKQGNTELNIGHAAEVVKRMEQVRPNPLRKEISDTPVLGGSSPMCGEQIEIPEDWLKKRAESREPVKANKNAYEIRTEVLGMALDWVKFKLDADGGRSVINEDHILLTAKKFYGFVENNNSRR